MLRCASNILQSTKQDDELEVDSDEEAKDQQTSTVKALTKTRGQGAFLKDAPAEADTLDKYMSDLTNKAPGNKDRHSSVFRAALGLARRPGILDFPLRSQTMGAWEWASQPG
eukprot:s1405_g3.t1